MQSPLKWFGGKYKLAPQIVDLLPPHKTYVEPFGGGASVLFAKPPSTVEVYNDLNSDLVNLFKVLRHPQQSKELHRLLVLTPHAKEEYEDALKSTSTDPVEKARCFFTVIRQSFNSIPGQVWTTGIDDNIAQAIRNAVDRLPEVIQRLRHVQIDHRDAIKVISTYDTPDTLFFCDPPYVHSTRARKKAYTHEMTDEQHTELLKTLLNVKGMVILSGYASPLYSNALPNWKKITIKTFTTCNDNRSKRTEVLWFNQKCYDASTADCIL